MYIQYNMDQLCLPMEQQTESGYEVRLRHYRSQECTGCPLKDACTKAKGNREIRVSLKYLRYKRQTREKLRSEEGYALSVRRMIEPESAFGQMKNNRNFRRFLLRGLPKVGWLSLAHNLLKWAAMNQKGRVREQLMGRPRICEYNRLALKYVDILLHA
ncbi:transposase [Paenibacillus sp. JMULE4]|uniref:transposase n=1 Tax=Paenibacillus sp. JMULE4 TaxID=2518342 RepID=UPI0020C602C7|nr:transposase [Paenibacillus sp. JMULE4]